MVEKGDQRAGRRPDREGFVVSSWQGVWKFPTSNGKAQEGVKLQGDRLQFPLKKKLLWMLLQNQIFVRKAKKQGDRLGVPMAATQTPETTVAASWVSGWRGEET